MRRLISTGLVAAICCCSTGTVQAQITWRRSFGGSGSDVAKSVRVTSDGNYIVCGSTGSFGAGGGDVYLALLDTDGDLIWSKTYGGAGADQGNCVRQTADGGFIIAGLTNSFGAGGYDGYVVKTDASGNEEWSQTYGGSDWDSFNSIELGSTYAIVAGQTSSAPSVTQDSWIVRIEIDGQVMWESRQGGAGVDFANAAKLLTSGEVVACGAVEIGQDVDVWIGILDQNGALVWDSAYGGDSTDLARDVVQTLDGGFSLLGSTESFSQFTEAYHLKLDPNGVLIWERNWGQIADQQGYELLQLADGRFASAHGVRTSGAGGEDMFLLQSYSDGSFQSGSTYGGVEDDAGYSLSECADGGFVLAGVTMSFGVGVRDVMVVKTGADGLTASEDVLSEFDPLAIEVPESKAEVQLMPNPTSGAFSVSANRATLLQVLDSQGRQVFASSLEVAGITNVSVDLCTGVYMTVATDRAGAIIWTAQLLIIR